MTKIILDKREKIDNWEKCICGNLSEMYCICEGVYDTRKGDPEADVYEISHYKILKCPSCGQVLIVRYVKIDGNIDDDFENNSPYTEYEREMLYAPGKQRHDSVPSMIADIVTQAERVVPVSPRAAFILCRATLEQICRERNIPDTRTNSKTGEIERLDLKTRLNLLLEREKLSKDIREIMHGIREIGNAFTHESQIFLTDKVPQEEVEVLIGLIDYILDRLYVDKALAQKAVTDLNILRNKVLGSKLVRATNELAPPVE